MPDDVARDLPLSTPILVTGGSGFIGTNVVQHLLDLGYENVRTFDVAAPQHPRHRPLWVGGDVCNAADVIHALENHAPQRIVHLAARTDLDGARIVDYAANTDGVANLIEAVQAVGGVERVLFSSSQLVCAPGYSPHDEFDVCPPNPYGESKVAGERLVRERMGDETTWMLLRPTTIWGPWWGPLYSAFFRAVGAGRYVHPRGVRVTKGFGFVGNTAHHVATLLASPPDAIHGRTIYLSDYEPYPILDWAQEIADEFGARRVREVPVPVLRALAKAGDLLKRVGMSDPPITSYRLANMLTPTRFDMAPLEELCGPLPFSRADGTAATVAWMRGER
jgi:nucleoside-diphosphate-sugar epimerase